MMHNLEPMFTTVRHYLIWRKRWRARYNELSRLIRSQRSLLRVAQRTKARNAARLQSMLALLSREAANLMELRRAGTFLRDSIRELRKAPSSIPASIEAKTVDLHFNKGHINDPAIPRWVLRAKGVSHYVNHIDARMDWSTRELTSGSTLGMIRLRNCRVEIDERSNAVITAA